jgi:hypothetical protein
LAKAAYTDKEDQQSQPPHGKVFHSVSFPRLTEFMVLLANPLPDFSTAPISMASLTRSVPAWRYIYCHFFVTGNSIVARRA